MEEVNERSRVTHYWRDWSTSKPLHYIPHDLMQRIVAIIAVITEVVWNSVQRRISNADSQRKIPFQCEAMSEQPVPENSSVLACAFHEKIRPYIDLIDDLRRFGLDQDVNLPTVVVIGDQSSGKSSIIEAISGVQLPRGSGIVTRCPLEMQLKKVIGVEWQATLRYQPYNATSEREYVVNHPDDLESKILNAQNEITGNNTYISDSLITLKVVSPNCPDLTMIDLPGIARTAIKGQPADICRQITDLLRKHAAKDNTIMLCVIPSNVDIATNEALSLAREFDPTGQRTLGVVTKPDLVDAGTEREVLSVVRNEKFYLEKGYSIVKCRGQLDIDQRISLTDAHEKEEAFFRDHEIFSELPSKICGSKNLARKLTENLVEHIRKTLPDLRTEMEGKMNATCEELSSVQCGPPEAKGEQTLFLIKAVESYISRVENILCHDGDVDSAVIDRRLREISKNCSITYQWRLRFAALKKEIEDITNESQGKKTSLKRRSKGGFGDLELRQIEKELPLHRGSELPCFNSFKFFQRLVVSHLKKYRAPLMDCLNKMNSDVDKLVQYCCDEQLVTLPGVKVLVRRVCDEVREECKKRGAELIEFELQREELVFTQDETFLEYLRGFEKAAEEARANEPINSYAPPVTPAQEMHRLVVVYLTIANKRLQDTVPTLILVTQHIDFVKNLKDRLLRKAIDNDDEDLLREDSATAIQRKLLEKKSERLALALEKLRLV